MINEAIPQSVDIEQALLGTFLVYTNSIKQALEHGLVEDNFYDNRHKFIFNAMKGLSRDNINTDVVSVMDRLKEAKALERAGGVMYLTDLTTLGSSKSSIEGFIDTLEDKKTLRSLLDLSNKINHNILKSTLSPEDLMAEAEKEILEITRSRRTTEFSHVEDIMPRLLEEIKVKSEKGTGITGLETGFSDLDRLTGGFQKGDLIILAARASVGKTALALNLAKNMALLNKEPVAIFSLEMPENSLVQRIVSAHGDIPGNKLRDGLIYSNNDWNKLFKSANEVQQLPIVIDDSSSITTSEIFSKCRKLKNEHGLGVIIIDYLQLLSSRSRGRSREQEVAEIARSLKELARELDVPVIALSQLSRRVEMREDKRPILSDLRESGSIEQDSDIVAFLHREEYYSTEAEESDNQVMEVILRKHRNGALGTVELAFKKSANAFYTLSR